jgi:hypothetical protein
MSKRDRLAQKLAKADIKSWRHTVRRSISGIPGTETGPILLVVCPHLRCALRLDNQKEHGNDPNAPGSGCGRDSRSRGPSDRIADQLSSPCDDPSGGDA